MKRYSKITAGWGLSMYRSHDDMDPVWKDFYTRDEAYDYVDRLNRRASDYESIYLLKSGPNGPSTEDVYENNKWHTGRSASAKSGYTNDTFSELVSQYEFDYANGKPIDDIWDEIFTEYADEDLADDVTAELEQSVEVVDRNPMYSSKRIRRGRYIKSNTFTYPQYIEVEREPNIWIKYKKLYEHEGGGCYYTTSDDYSPVTSFISLYPDGHLTYLWDGVEKAWNKSWRQLTIVSSQNLRSFMDQYICANSNAGTYNGVTWGVTEGDNRYYFETAPGKFCYADNEDQLQSKIDKWLSSGRPKTVEGSQSLEQLKYRGIWYGATKNPISVKDLLDRIIDKDGQGFNIRLQFNHSSDQLLNDSGSVSFILIDEEGRGRFKLSEDSIQYLEDNLGDSSWLGNKLREYVNRYARKEV